MSHPGSTSPAPRSPSDGERTGIVHRLSGVPTPVIFVASIAIAVLVLWRGGALTDSGSALRHADMPTFVAGMLLYLVGLTLLCARWDQIVRMVNGVSNLPCASEAFLTSVVINYAAPIGLAVPARAALTKRALGLNAAETGAVALWEVTVDVLVLSLLSVAWLLLGGWKLDVLHGATTAEQIAGAVLIVTGLVVVAAAGWIVAHRKPALWVKARRAAKTIATFPTRRPVDALRIVAITVLYWFGQAAVLWLLLRALDVSPSPTLLLGLVSLPMVAGMLSPVPGGAGVREIIMIAVANVHETDSAPVLLAALTYRIALFASIPILYVALRFWIAKHPPPAVADPQHMAVI